MKKIISLMLVLCMVLSLGMPAFAAVSEAGKGSPEAGVYNVYIEGKVDSTSNVSIALVDGETVGYAYQMNTKADGSYSHKFRFEGAIEDYILQVRDSEGFKDITDSVITATYTPEMIVHEMDVVNNEDAATIAEGNSVYVNALVKNKYGDDNFKITYMLAAYDDDERLLGCKILPAENYDYFADETRKIDFSSYKMPGGTKKARVFAWTDVEKMIPVGETANITKETTIYFFGASTTTDYADYDWPQQGIRYNFERFFGDGVKVKQYAYAGWSLKTLQELSREKIGDAYIYDPDNSPYGEMLKVLKEGDYVIFGSTGNNEKWQTGFDNTDTATNVVYSNGDAVPNYTAMQSTAEFQKRLDDTVAELLDRGVTPIICTDLGGHTKEAFNNPAEVKASDYVACQEAVCKKYGIDFIDYRTAVYDYVKNVEGEDYEYFAGRYIMTAAAKKWYKENDHVGKRFSTEASMATDDFVHFTAAGAELFNAMLVQELKKTDNTINFYFKDK